MTGAEILGEPSGAGDIIIMPSESAESGRRVYDLTRGMCGRDFIMALMPVTDWNGELSPWEYKGGGMSFSGGGQAFLDKITGETVPQLREYSGRRDVRFFIGGYSLGGLFALWALYQTDIFSGAAACSGSFWYPRFTEYAEDNIPHGESIYLSLGTREEKTKNKLMSPVGDGARELYRYYEALPDVKNVVLEWNEGGHFNAPDGRTAKGFVWLLESE